MGVGQVAKILFHIFFYRVASLSNLLRIRQVEPNLGTKKTRSEDEISAIWLNELLKHCANYQITNIAVCFFLGGGDVVSLKSAGKQQEWVLFIWFFSYIYVAHKEKHLPDLFKSCHNKHSDLWLLIKYWESKLEYSVLIKICISPITTTNF